MERSRLESLLDALAGQPPGPMPARLCALAVQLLNVPGVGISLAHQDNYLQTAATAGLGASGEQLQLTLGSGPSYEAYRDGEPWFIEDLADETVPPILGGAARDAGIGAIFAFPLRFGAERSGVVTLYRDTPGPLSDSHHQDALLLAQIILVLLHVTETDPRSEDAYEDVLHELSDVVHKATGMVCVQLGVTLRDALAALRGHAFSTGRTISEVAHDVVTRRLQLGPEL